MALLSALCVPMACQSIKLGTRQCWQSWPGRQLNVYIMHIYVLASLVKIFSFVHIFQQVVWYTSKSHIHKFSASFIWENVASHETWKKTSWGSGYISDANALVSWVRFSAIIFFWFVIWLSYLRSVSIKAADELWNMTYGVCVWEVYVFGEGLKTVLIILT